MAIALPLIADLFQPVQGMVEWLAGGPAPRSAPATAGAGLPPAAAPRPLGVSVAQPVRRAGPLQRTWSGPTRSVRGARPLRVVRGAADRLVISGRIDEVCAELDRLAALEARS